METINEKLTPEFVVMDQISDSLLAKKEFFNIMSTCLIEILNAEVHLYTTRYTVKEFEFVGLKFCEI